LKELNIIGIALIVLVLVGSLLIVHFQAYATGCYDKFIFNWFSLNDVLLCLDSSSGGGGVTSLSSSNSAISLNATSGNILITPKYQLLCENSGSGVTTLTCNITTKKYLHVVVETSLGGAGGTTMQIGIRFNGDNSNIYNWRRSLNGGADTSGTNTECRIPFGLTNLNPADRIIFDMNIYNIDATHQKVFYGMSGKDNVGGGVPDRSEFACNWRNTNAQITSIEVMRATGTANYGTILIKVWGYD
jgi:hypothetical protein